MLHLLRRDAGEPEVIKKGKADAEARGKEARGRRRSNRPGRAEIARRGHGPSPDGPFLIVGLGNPGLEYLWTPHNAGFMAIDRIAQQEGVVVQNRRCRAMTATCRIAGRQVVLAKPETFMNLSGIAVAALLEEFEADPAKDLLVIYDELDLVLGTFKIRERGSPAGHNGARSVTGALDTQEWLRLRIGVGPDLTTGGDCRWAENGRAGIICSRPCARQIWRCWTRCWTGWQQPRGAFSKWDRQPR